MRLLLPLVTGAFVALILVQLVRSDAATTTTLLIALPLVGLLSIAVLALVFPTSESADDRPAFWRLRPGGVGAPIPNAAHPAARLVLGLWLVLALVWLGALVEALRA